MTLPTLELPEAGISGQLEGEVRVENPESLQLIKIHIPALSAATVYPRINGVSASTIQSVQIRSGELVSTLDLTLQSARYSLNGQRNIIEIMVSPGSENAEIRARWLILPMEKPQEEEPVAVAPKPPPVAPVPPAIISKM